MKPIVLDTDVISFLLKADSRAQLYLPHPDNRQWFISFMTEAELEQWALLANWGEKRIEWLRLFLSRFAIVPSSHDLVLKWRRRWSLLEETGGGSKPPKLGLRVAATALLYDAPLPTHNKADYLGVPGLRFS
jgi:tRNA(fMet)-specific endonuclease VapC